MTVLAEIKKVMEDTGIRFELFSELPLGVRTLIQIEGSRRYGNLGTGLMKCLNREEVKGAAGKYVTFLNGEDAFIDMEAIKNDFDPDPGRNVRPSALIEEHHCEQVSSEQLDEFIRVMMNVLFADMPELSMRIVAGGMTPETLKAMIPESVIPVKGDLFDHLPENLRSKSAVLDMLFKRMVDEAYRRVAASANTSAPIIDAIPQPQQPGDSCVRFGNTAPSKTPEQIAQEELKKNHADFLKLFPDLKTVITFADTCGDSVRFYQYHGIVSARLASQAGKVREFIIDPAKTRPWYSLILIANYTWSGWTPRITEANPLFDVLADIEKFGEDIIVKGRFTPSDHAQAVADTTVGDIYYRHICYRGVPVDDENFVYDTLYPLLKSIEIAGLNLRFKVVDYTSKYSYRLECGKKVGLSYFAKDNAEYDGLCIDVRYGSSKMILFRPSGVAAKNFVEVVGQAAETINYHGLFDTISIEEFARLDKERTERIKAEEAAAQFGAAIPMPGPVIQPQPMSTVAQPGSAR